jgi:hypothetical protein
MYEVLAVQAQSDANALTASKDVVAGRRVYDCAFVKLSAEVVIVPTAKLYVAGCQ